MTQQDIAERARNHARDLASITDDQVLFDRYAKVIKDDTLRDYRPYFVTAVRDIGLWDRLDREYHRRKARAA